MIQTTVTIRQIGNSSGVILPTQVLRSLNLHTGDTLNVKTDQGKITFEKGKPHYTLEQLIAKCDPTAPQVSHDWNNLTPVSSEGW